MGHRELGSAQSRRRTTWRFCLTCPAPIIESNAVLFDGAGMSRSGRKAPRTRTTWPATSPGARVVNCLSAGGGIGADCNGYPENGVRYDSPTWGGFSVSGGCLRR